MIVSSKRTYLTSAVILCNWFCIAGSQEPVSEPCVAPGGSPGVCIVLSECTAALERLVRPSGQADYDFLRKSHCGFNKTMPKVCCSTEIDKLAINFPKEGVSAIAGSRPPDILPMVVTTPYTPLTPPPAVAEESPQPGPPGSFSVSNRTNSTLTNQGGGSDSAHLNGSPTETFNTNIHLAVHDSSESGLLPTSDVCGSVANSNKIYGGENTSIDEFPWMVLLKYKAGGELRYGCGGVLISNRYVLTAAHCIKTPNNYKIMQVRLGDWDLETPLDCEGSLCSDEPLDLDIEETLVHPDYVTQNLTNDIALVRLVAPVNFSEWIQPICLPDSRDRDFTGEAFSVAGWGQTEERTSWRIKRKLEVGHVNLAVCSNAYRNLSITLGAGHVCAGGRRGQDACRGDSGGSLMKVLGLGRRSNYYAVGVVSLGPAQCGLEGWPGVYTKVSHYVQWIKSNLRP